MNEKTVEIFSYRVYGGQPGSAGRWVMSDYKATRESIESLGGEIIQGTGETVRAGEISPDGHKLASQANKP